MIQVEGLGKRFGDTWALRGLDFRVEPGTFLGVLGRNGAGKTTLLRILTGQMTPSEGRARILGLDIADRPIGLRRRLGVMPEAGGLLEGMTGEQYLCFVGQIHGLNPTLLRERMGELGDLIEIDFRQASQIAAYSFGMKKKVALAAALLHAPELLFLDEPFEGLDPVGSDRLRVLLESLNSKGVTVVLTSHVLTMAERLCSRFLLVDQGRVLVDAEAKAMGEEVGRLEQLFLSKVDRGLARELSWM